MASSLFLAVTVLAAAFTDVTAFGGIGGAPMSTVCANEYAPMPDAPDTSLPNPDPMTFTQSDMGFAGGIQIIEYVALEATEEDMAAAVTCMTSQTGVRQYFIAPNGNYAMMPGASLIMSGFVDSEHYNAAMMACVMETGAIYMSRTGDKHEVTIIGDDTASIGLMYMAMGMSLEVEVIMPSNVIGYFAGPMNYIIADEGRVEHVYSINERYTSPEGGKEAFEAALASFAAGHYRPGCTQWLVYEVPCGAPADTGCYVNFATFTYERFFTEDRWTTEGENLGKSFMDLMWSVPFGDSDNPYYPFYNSIFTNSAFYHYTDGLMDVINMYTADITTRIEVHGKPWVYTGDVQLPYPQGLHLGDCITVDTMEQAMAVQKMTDQVAGRIYGMPGVVSFTSFHSSKDPLKIWIFQNYKDVTTYRMAMARAMFETGVMGAYISKFEMTEHYFTGDATQDDFPDRLHKVSTGFFYNTLPLATDSDGGWLQFERFSKLPDNMVYPEIVKYLTATVKFADDVAFFAWIWEPNGYDMTVVSGYSQHSANQDKDHTFSNADTFHMMAGMGVDSLSGLDYNYGTQAPINPETAERWPPVFEFFGDEDTPGIAQFTSFFGADDTTSMGQEYVAGFVFPGQGHVIGKPMPEPMCMSM